MTTDPALISADQGTFTPVRGSDSSCSAASLKAESSVNILNVHTPDLDTPRLYRGKHTMCPKKCSAAENRSKQEARRYQEHGEQKLQPLQRARGLQQPWEVTPTG